MAEPKDALAREIDEELRREQMLKLWEKYGTYVVGAVVLIVLGVGGFKYIEHRNAQAAEAAGVRFAGALREMAQKKDAEAQKALQDIASTAPAGYAVLARLRLAAADRAAGKTAEAVAAYEAIAKERSIDPLIADYCRLQAAMLRLDSASFTEMQNRLNDLTAASNAWRFSARELLGVAAYKGGNAEEARKQFQQLLADRAVPAGIADRARVMMAILAEAELAKDGVPVPPKAEPAAKPAPPTEDKGKAKGADKKPK